MLSEMRSAESDAQQQKLQLALDLLRSGQSISIKALGSSMIPTIWPGDVVMIESNRGRGARRGDVVLVRSEDGIRVHRLVENSGLEWITRGDAMPQNDPPTQPSEVLGRVVEIHRGQRAVPITWKPALAGRVLALLISRSQLCERVALRAHALRQAANSGEADHPSAAREGFRCN
jgi:signal peptidase I